MSRLIDITGERFGRLVVLERRPSLKGRSNARWFCICDCGKTTTVQGDRLKNGQTQSCGCLQKERANGPTSGHRLSRSRLYGIWHSMKQRCCNTNNKKYPIYGGRGIYVCSEWLKNPKAFYDWAIERGYQDNLTIDRLNNDGPYSPENCRWTTNTENQNNRSNNKLATYNGITKNVTQWGKELDLDPELIRKRLSLGWSDEDALTRPVRKHVRKK